MNKTDILPFYSLLPTPYSLLPVPCSLFPVPWAQPYNLLTLHGHLPQ
ncbi:MAG: hypothetical protein F6K26_34875 [Moorea sp. SIO2I5]|nr:hypothetical protein [Moorena sp. SIO2I5]